MEYEKNIEEMAYVIYKYGQCYDDCVEGAEYNLSKYLINAGYRKIAEGSVVLTREEYELLTNDLDKCDYGDFENGYSQGYAQGNKETAEKFAKRLKERKETMPTPARYVDMVYVEDIDEICKEITEGQK